MAARNECQAGLEAAELADMAAEAKLYQKKIDLEKSVSSVSHFQLPLLYWVSIVSAR